MEKFEVPVGRFGYVALVTLGVAEEHECFVAAQDETHAVILVPAGGTVSPSTATEQSFVLSGAAASAAMTLPVSGMEIGVEVKKVPADSVRALAQSKRCKARFEPHRPNAGVLLSAFYHSATSAPDSIAKLDASSTDDGGAGKRVLERENQKLVKEVAELKRQQSFKSTTSRSGVPNHVICSGSEGSEGSGLESCVSGDEEDPIVKQLKELNVKAVLESRGAGRASGRARPAQSSRETAPADTAEPAPRVSRRQVEKALEREVQLETLKLLKELRSGAGGHRVLDDAPEHAQDLDGVRVARSLGRMRALREHIHAQPERVSEEYKDHWVRELGAEGRAFRWIDRNRAIRWKKYSSIRRVDWMLCNIPETMETGNHRLAQAQLIQCLKSLHEFSNFGSWKAAWALTHMVDPLNKYQHGGMEVETEVTLAWLKTKDDLAAKVLRGSTQTDLKELISEDEGEGGDGADKKKTQPPKGPGKTKKQ